MFKGALERDLKTLFDVKKVKFTAPAFGKELSILFCELGECVLDIRAGTESARVQGRISIISQENQCGYLSKKIAQCPNFLDERFFFSREEPNLSLALYDDKLFCYTMEFIYFYEAQYNVPQKMTWKGLVVDFIKRRF